MGYEGVKRASPKAEGHVADQQTVELFSSVASAIVSGFQLVAAAGPLCNEPLSGVCFILERVVVLPVGEASGQAEGQGGISGQAMSTMKTVCR